MTTAIELALRSNNLIDSVYASVEEVRSFDETSEELLSRIKKLKPSLQMLSEMRGQENEMLKYEQQKGEMAAFSELLREILEVFNAIDVFTTELKNKGSVKRWFKKKKISQQFTSFEKRLTVCVESIQFSVLLSMKKTKTVERTKHTL